MRMKDQMAIIVQVLEGDHLKQITKINLRKSQKKSNHLIMQITTNMNQGQLRNFPKKAMMKN